MENLQLRVDGMKINPLIIGEGVLSKIDDVEFTLSATAHKFVVVNPERSVLSLYAAQVAGHSDILQSFGKRGLVGVGGGSFFTDPSNVLHFGHYSRSYGRVPEPVLEQFAPLLKDALVQAGISVEGIRVESYDAEYVPFLDYFWRKLGYS